MGTLVGDAIVRMRELGPDPCRTLLAPAQPVLTGATGAGAFPLLSTLFMVVTAVNLWGETTASAEATLVLSGTQNTVTLSVPWAQGTQFIRVYYGTTAGGENAYEQFAVGASSPLAITVLNAPISGFPPLTNRAYLPDSDGGFVGSQTAYGWLNEALRVLARAAGGIQDTCGIASVSGQRRYVAPSQWLKFTNAFYDGWELEMGNRAETFRNRNLTANIAISLMADAQSDTTRVELYWTPSRTAGLTTTSAPLLATDANVAINAAAGWALADGMAQVGSEIISYSAITGTQLQNIIRGWNGTRTPASLASGAAVKELNIELVGYRMPAVYSVGDSAVALGVPPGWEPFLQGYMLGKFRDAEQERQEGSALIKEATTGIEQWAKSNKPVAGPRQCRMYGDYGIRGLVPGGLSGGLIIP